MGLIYQILNTVTGDFYIGKTTTTLYKRYREHLQRSRGTGTKSIIHNSIRKYGEDNFVCIVVKEVREDDDIDSLEKHYIKWLKPRYNIKSGGDGGEWDMERREHHKRVGTYKKSEEQRRRISEEKKGKPLFVPPEKRKEINKKLSENHKGLNTWTKNKKWWNNGVEVRYCEEQPEGFVRGRLKSHTRGLQKGLVVGSKLTLTEEELQRRRDHCKTIQKLSPNNNKGRG